jgi:hypothetical protein
VSERVIEDALVVGGGGGEVGVRKVEEEEAGGVEGETLQIGGRGRRDGEMSLGAQKEKTRRGVRCQYRCGPRL